MSKPETSMELREGTAFFIDLRDGYVLTGMVNADNENRSWWMTKKGYTKSTYCFSTFSDGIRMKADLKSQLAAIEDYIKLFDTTCC